MVAEQRTSRSTRTPMHTLRDYPYAWYPYTMFTHHLLVSSPAFLSTEVPMNPYTTTGQVDLKRAQAEHAALVDAFIHAGFLVSQVPAPVLCPDGVYTANWALVHDGVAVMARLPHPRTDEEYFARGALTNLGIRCVEVPAPFLFSGQGDALTCGRYLLAGSGYRSDAEAQQFAAATLGLELVQLETVPLLDGDGQVVINEVTGRPDSLFYDLDLALGVIDAKTIAYVPEAFTDTARASLEALPLERIVVDYDEAVGGFACNFVSTGGTVIMSDQAPKLQAELERRGYEVVTPHIRELQKGGGFIRCVSLSLAP